MHLFFSLSTFHRFVISSNNAFNIRGQAASRLIRPPALTRIFLSFNCAVYRLQRKMFHLFHSRENCFINLCINRSLMKFFLNYFGPHWTKLKTSLGRAGIALHQKKWTHSWFKNKQLIDIHFLYFSLKKLQSQEIKKKLFLSHWLSIFSHFKLSPDFFVQTFTVMLICPYYF